MFQCAFGALAVRRLGVPIPGVPSRSCRGAAEGESSGSDSLLCLGIPLRQPWQRVGMSRFTNQKNGCFGAFRAFEMSCLFPLAVRGSEGLYMVNGPPTFTESTAFQRYQWHWRKGNRCLKSKGGLWHWKTCEYRRVQKRDGLEGCALAWALAARWQSLNRGGRDCPWCRAPQEHSRKVVLVLVNKTLTMALLDTHVHFLFL